jgi:ABC-type nitrate/sulfonate/bicarbonate transport system ATPase subunit
MLITVLNERGRNYMFQKNNERYLEINEDYDENNRFSTTMFRNYSILKLLSLEDNVFLTLQKQAFEIKNKEKAMNWSSEILEKGLQMISIAG